MLNALHTVENELLNLLGQDGWQTLDVTYHPPHVERVWRTWNEYRVYFHRIHPCKKGQALFHPHPWASAIYIAEGKYEMGLGTSQDATKLISKMILPAGTYYEMTESSGWHYVRPLTLVHSLMITRPWSKDIKIAQPNKEKHVAKELDKNVFHEIIGFFYQHYRDRS